MQTFIVALCKKEICKNEKSLWDNLLEKFPINNKSKGSKYYNDLQNLAASFSAKFDKDQIHEIWRGTDTCLDYAFEFIGPANYDNYKGNKLEDIIESSIGLVFTDIACLSDYLLFKKNEINNK